MTQPYQQPMEETPPGGGGGSDNPLTRKLGAFPLWVWLGLGLAGALAYANWHKSKTAASQQSLNGSLPTTQTASGSTPASLIPQFVNQVYENPTPPVVNVNTPVTVNNPPGAPGPAGPPGPGGPPGGDDHGHNPPPKPAGTWVTAGVWSSTNAPWNSTLWGIAQHVYGNGAQYPKIFAANKVGVMRPDGTAGFISNPNLIHPGDRIFVPA